MKTTLALYAALLMLVGSSWAVSESLPSSLLNQIKAAPSIESITNTINTDAQWTTFANDLKQTATIVQEIANKFNVSQAVVAAHLTSPAAGTILENLLGKNRTLSADVASQTLHDALASYTGTPASINAINALLKQGLQLPPAQTFMTVNPATNIETGASTRRFLMGFGIYRVARDNNDANLRTRDKSFGNLKDSQKHEDQGKAYANAGTESAHSTTAMLQPDGKIVAAGVADEYKLVVARFSPDGQLDTSFAQGKGVVVIPVGTDPRSQNSQYTTPTNIIIQNNGNILVYGRFIDAKGQFLFAALFDANGKSLGAPVIFTGGQIR